MLFDEADLSTYFSAMPAVEDRILHLYEIDPTHATGEPQAAAGAVPRAPVPALRSSLPLCLFTGEATVALLLELDPTHELACEAMV